jgi:hypothetical protein
MQTGLNLQHTLERRIQAILNDPPEVFVIGHGIFPRFIPALMLFFSIGLVAAGYAGYALAALSALPLILFMKLVVDYLSGLFRKGELSGSVGLDELPEVTGWSLIGFLGMIAGLTSYLFVALVNSLLLVLFYLALFATRILSPASTWTSTMIAEASDGGSEGKEQSALL